MAAQAVKRGPTLHAGLSLAPEIFPAPLGEDFDTEQSKGRWSEDVSNVIFGDSDYQQMRSLETTRTMIDGVCGDCRRSYCPAFNAACKMAFFEISSCYMCVCVCVSVLCVCVCVCVCVCECVCVCVCVCVCLLLTLSYF